jgi:hypothetical protein
MILSTCAVAETAAQAPPLTVCTIEISTFDFRPKRSSSTGLHPFPGLVP